MVAGLLMVMFLRWFENKQVYVPTSRFDREGDWLGRPWEDVYFEAADGTRLNGWFFPCDTGSRNPQVVILLCHGNAGNISHRFEKYSVLLELGVNVFAFDYRGYGRSAGTPGEKGTYLDALAAHAWLVRKGFSPTNVVGLGESLGGGIVSELARRAPLGGMILQSTFTSVPRLGKELFPWLPVGWLARIHYDTLGKLSEIRVPTLILHSRGDTLIGFHHAEQNFEAASDPKWLRELSGDHNETLSAGRSQYQSAIREFLVSSGLRRE
jgi:uncharacterized protein